MELEPVSLETEKERTMIWFGVVECKDDFHRIKLCTVMGQKELHGGVPKEDVMGRYWRECEKIRSVVSKECTGLEQMEENNYGVNLLNQLRLESGC